MVIGRRLELDTCAAMLGDAVSRRGRLLVVSGEAGIGKTSLAREVLDRAWAAGFVTRWGAYWDTDPSAFGAWIDALSMPGGDACAAAADQLEVGGESAVDEASATRARHRLFSDVSDALRSAAEQAPQLIVLEDMHWADVGSIELLRAVTARLPEMRALVVATCRSDELSPSSLGAGGSIEHLQLGGLDQDDVARVLEETLGRPPSQQELLEIVRRTGGNPLFVTEVGRLAASGSMAVVPPGVRELLGRRMARLSPATDRLLGVASVAGTNVDSAQVAVIADVSESEVLAALDEAVEASLLDAGEGVSRRWAFAHELVRATRYELLGAAERAVLHAAWLSELAAVGAPAGVLDRHASRAGLAPDDERASRFALAAGDEAALRFAWDAAIERYERALASAPQGLDGEPVRAAAWLGLGNVRLRTGANALSAFDAAAECGRRLGDPDVVARAALGFGAGFGGFEVQLLDPHQVELLEEAASALAHDAPLRSMVLARLSVALSFVGSAEDRLALADQAIEAARLGSHPRALGSALAARCDAMAGPDHVEQRLEMSAEIVDIARRIGEPELELLGRRLRIVALLERRDLTGFDAEVSNYAFAAATIGDALYDWWVPLWRGTRAHADGRFDDARELRADARERGLEGGSSNADVLWLIARLFQALDEGDAAALDATWWELTERHPGLFHQTEAVAGIRAFAAARFGDAPLCRAALESAGPEALDRLPKDQEWLTVVAQYLAAAVVAGDEATIRRCYDLLRPYEGIGVFEGAAAVDRGVADRFLAVGAAMLGDPVAARAHTERALVGNADAGDLVLAQTRADAAWALLHGDSADVGRARELAELAAAQFTLLGLNADANAARVLIGDRPRQGAKTPSTHNALVREGDTWAVTFGATTVRIKHAKGIADLATLLKHQGQEVHVRVLEGVDAVTVPGGGDAVLDEVAVAQYRDRLQDLELELDEAGLHADLARAEKLAAERDALIDELTKAFGLGGRPRTAGSDPDDRLRKAVSARIKASIGRLDKLEPALGRHLDHSVRTGFRCVYDPEEPTVWRVDTDRTS